MGDEHSATFWFKPGSIAVFTHLVCVELFLRKDAAAVATIAILTMHADISPNRIMFKITSMPKSHTLTHPAQRQIALDAAFSTAHLAVIAIVTPFLVWNRPCHVVIRQHTMRFHDAVVKAVSETSRALDGVIAAREDFCEPIVVFVICLVDIV